MYHHLGAILQRADITSRERGASITEYALLLVFVFIAALLSIRFFGDSIVALFETSSSTLDNAPNATPEG